MKSIDLNCDMGESFGTCTLGMDEDGRVWQKKHDLSCQELKSSIIYQIGALQSFAMARKPEDKDKSSSS